MVTPRGDRSLRWKMPPLFLSDRADQVGRVDTRQSGSADVTQTPSLPLSLPLSLLVLRGRWNAQISRGRRRRRRCCSIPLEKCPTPFKSQPLCLLRPPETGRRRRGREGEEERGGGGERRRHLFHGPLLCEARFSDHSFILLASQPLSQPAASAVRPHIMAAGRTAEAV